MAEKTGSSAFELRGNFDPRTLTLREYMDLYVVSAQMEGGRALQNWENKVLANPVYKLFLDRPVVDIFASDLEIDGMSIQEAAEAAEADLPRGGSAPTLQSRIRAIEEGVFNKLSEIDTKEGTDLLKKYRPATPLVKKLSTRGAVKTAAVQYKTSAIGELIKNLEAHVEKFPEDKPIANAILFNLETGSRPSLTTELTSNHYVNSQASEATKMLGASDADGLLIPAGTKGVKRAAKDSAPNLQPYNAPLSQRAVTILQDQSDFNTTSFGDNRRLAFFFQIEDAEGAMRPIELDDINRVLKATSPPGIVQKIGAEGGITPTDKKLTSSDLRKLFINAAEAAGVPKENVAALISRDVAKNTGSHGLYIGNAGEYSINAVNDLNQISRQMWGQYSIEASAEGREAFKSGQLLLSSNTLLFGDNTEDRTKTRTFETWGSGKPLEIPIQVGGFAAPKATGETALGGQPPAGAASTPKIDSQKLAQGLVEGFNSIDESKLKVPVAVAKTVGRTTARAIPFAGIPFIPARSEELQERYDMDPAQSYATAIAEEFTPAGPVMLAKELAEDVGQAAGEAAVEAVDPAFKEETGTSFTLQNLDRAATGFLTRGRFNYSSGGFINRRR